MYSEKQHAKDLLKSLEGELCEWCPNLTAMKDRKDMHPDAAIERCMVCNDFIKLNHPFFAVAPGCPCIALGKQEAAKRSWIALEEKGYI